MLLVGRTFGENYRFGFNTQEQDNEVYGNGNLNTALFWEYDTRLGRRWNKDPILKVFESPYIVFNNNPIIKIDLNGDNADWYKRVDGDGCDNSSYVEIEPEEGTEGDPYVIDGKTYVWVCETEAEKEDAISKSCYENILSQKIDLSKLKMGENVGPIESSKENNSESKTQGTSLPTEAPTPKELEQESLNENLLMAIWYSPIARYCVPDKFSVGLGGEVTGILGGGAEPLNLTILTRGKEPGIYTAPSFSYNIVAGGGPSGGLNVTRSYYNGDPRNITASMLTGDTFGGVASLKVVAGGSAGLSFSPSGGNKGFINITVGVGTGFDAFAGYQRSYTPGYGVIWKW